MPSLSATRFKLFVADSHGEAKVSLRSCAKGVGLFANRDIAAGTLVAYAPATVSCMEQRRHSLLPVTLCCH